MTKAEAQRNREIKKMKRWLRDVSGAVLASLLTLALNGKVYADVMLAQFFSMPAEIIAPSLQAAAENAICSQTYSPRPPLTAGRISFHETMEDHASNI